MLFADFVDIDSIEEVHIRNNSGSFALSPYQIKQFKKEIAITTYAPNMSAKVGAIGITIIIGTKKHILHTSTHGEYMEVHSSIATKNREKISQEKWLYFRTNGINFDNYQKKNRTTVITRAANKYIKASAK